MTPEEAFFNYIKDKTELKEFVEKEKTAFTSALIKRLEMIGRPDDNPWLDATTYPMFEGWLLAMDKIRQENTKLKGG